MSGRLDEAGKSPTLATVLTNPRVRELDRMLDVLERLNLSDQSAVPCWLEERLSEFGIAVGCRSVTELIECCFDAQAAFKPVVTEPKRRSGWMQRRRQLAASGRMVLMGNAALLSREEIRARRKREQAHVRWVRWQRLHGEERNRARRAADAVKRRKRRWYHEHREETLVRDREGKRAARAIRSAPQPSAQP